MKNRQPVEKRIRVNSTTQLEVHSVFKTIQGEGPFTGHRAVFVRFAGCNLQCPSCDTEYTENRKYLTPQELVDVVAGVSKGEPCLVVITGGEPFRQNHALLTDLFDTLLQCGYFIQVETNGTLPPPIYHYSHFPPYLSGVYIVCSPKTGKVHKGIEDQLCAYKYVMSWDSMDPEDGLPIKALGHSAAPRVARPKKYYDGPIYLQPVDHKNESDNIRSLGEVVNSCLKHGYILQLQVHKLIGVE